MTGHVTWPLHFTLGARHLICFSTASAGGFTDRDLQTMAELLPALASVLEVRMRNRLARDLLDTYVGPHASEKILTGAVHRGDGFTIATSVMVVDLRDFTSISELWPRDDVMCMLNDYFDALCDPIEENGGEVLKFMGDGLLAIFPDDAARTADAVIGIRRSMAALNSARAGKWQPQLACGIGVNYGDVMYGNIGSRRRLDFTVIGPAVNVASRLEGLNKTLGCNALFSAAYAEKTGDHDRLKPCGTFRLRGVAQMQAVYCLSKDTASLALSPFP